MQIRLDNIEKRLFVVLRAEDFATAAIAQPKCGCLKANSASLMASIKPGFTMHFLKQRYDFQRSRRRNEHRRVHLQVEETNLSGAAARSKKSQGLVTLRWSSMMPLTIAGEATARQDERRIRLLRLVICLFGCYHCQLASNGQPARQALKLCCLEVMMACRYRCFWA